MSDMPFKTRCLHSKSLPEKTSLGLGPGRGKGKAAPVRKMEPLDLEIGRSGFKPHPPHSSGKMQSAGEWGAGALRGASRELRPFPRQSLEGRQGWSVATVQGR